MGKKNSILTSAASCASRSLILSIDSNCSAGMGGWSRIKLKRDLVGHLKHWLGCGR